MIMSLRFCFALSLNIHSHFVLLLFFRLGLEEPVPLPCLRFMFTSPIESFLYPLS